MLFAVDNIQSYTIMSVNYMFRLSAHDADGVSEDFFTFTVE